MIRKLPFSLFPLAFITCLTIFGLSPVQSNAQGLSSSYFQAGVPMNHFAANLDGSYGWGFGMQHLRKLGQSPLAIGAGMNVMGYGGDRWDEYWAIGESVYDAEYEIENCIFDLEARLRFQPEVRFPIRPYGEAFAGVSTISTTFRVTDLNNGNDCDNNFYEEVLSRDVMPVYGAGFGLMIPLCRDGSMYLDMAATYRQSGAASYMNDDFDQVFSSRTEMWLFRLGITMSTF